MKKVLLMLLSLTLVFACVGCSSGGDASTDTNTGTTDTSDQTYYMVVFSASDELWEPAKKGFEDAAAMLGVKAEFAGPQTDTTADQAAVLEQVTGMGASGIAITCNDGPGMADSINKSMEAGVPVVCFDGDSKESNRLSYIGTSNYTAGAAGAAQLAKEMNYEGEVFLFTILGPQSHADRLQGAKDYIEQNCPKMHIAEVLGVSEPGTDVSAAKFAAAYQVHPEVKGQFSTMMFGTAGAAQTCKELGVKDFVNVGFDTDMVVLSCIKEGTASSTISQNFYIMGFQSLLQLYAYNNGSNPYENWKDANVAGIPSSIDTGVSICTIDNIDLFWKED